LKVTIWVTRQEPSEETTALISITGALVAALALTQRQKTINTATKRPIIRRIPTPPFDNTMRFYHFIMSSQKLQDL
jgi:hypothetical protein